MDDVRSTSGNWKGIPQVESHTTRTLLRCIILPQSFMLGFKYPRLGIDRPLTALSYNQWHARRLYWLKSSCDPNTTHVHIQMSDEIYPEASMSHKTAREPVTARPNYCSEVRWALKESRTVDQNLTGVVEETANEEKNTSHCISKLRHCTVTSDTSTQIVIHWALDPLKTRNGQHQPQR